MGGWSFISASILEKITFYLNAEDIFTLRCVCGNWRKILLNNNVFQRCRISEARALRPELTGLLHPNAANEIDLRFANFILQRKHVVSLFDIFGENISSLIVSNQALWNDEIVNIISERARNLTEYYQCFCSGVSSRGLSLFFSSNRAITKLTLDSCISADDELLASIGQNLGSLRSISLKNTHITANGIADLVRGSNGIMAMIIDGCSEVTDDGIWEIVTHLKDLRRLSLSNCYMVSDGSIAQLAKHCLSITTLDLSWLKRVTDTSGRLLAGLNKLERLNLSHTSIGDNTVVSLLMGSSLLRTIDLSFTHVTDESVQGLISYSQVSSILVSGCEGVSRSVKDKC